MLDSFATLFLIAVYAVYAWIVARTTRERLERKIGGLERRIEELEARLSEEGEG